MQTTQLTTEQLAPSSPPRRRRSALRLSVAAALVVCAAVGLRHTVENGQTGGANRKVFPVSSALDDTDRANLPGGPSNPHTGAVRSPDTVDPVAPASVGDPADASNLLPQGGSGGD